jgi:hypothetical protein
VRSSTLKAEIIALIALQDMVNLRLSSRTWAIACTPFVFRDGLTIRPYGNGMQNFNEICSQPRFANQIKHLSISVHELDHEPLKPWMIEAHNLPLEEIDPGDFLKHLSRPAPCCYDAKLFSETFPQLRRLRSVSITSAAGVFRRNYFQENSPIYPPWTILYDSTHNKNYHHLQHDHVSVSTFSAFQHTIPHVMSNESLTLHLKVLCLTRTETLTILRNSRYFFDHVRLILRFLGHLLQLDSSWS